VTRRLCSSMAIGLAGSSFPMRMIGPYTQKVVPNGRALTCIRFLQRHLRSGAVPEDVFRSLDLPRVSINTFREFW
jgi:hypothetical protein